MPTGSEPTLIVRADGSATMGLGHVMRSFALASHWRRSTGPVLFLTRQLPMSVVAIIRNAGIEVRKIDDDLSVSEECEELAASLHRLKPAWLVFDGYQFDSAYRVRLKTTTCRTLVIDDVSSGEFLDADVILNPNTAIPMPPYRTRPSTRLLLGPRYALLREEIVACRRPNRIAGDLKHILVTLGGGNAGELLHYIAAYVLSSRLPDDVRVTALAGHLADAAGRFGRHPRISLLQGLDGNAVATLMNSADLAISAAGSTCWELACLGLPALLVVLAENQRMIAESLQASGFAVSLGFRDEVTAELLGEALERAADPEWRQRATRIGQTLVDGHGTARVTAVMNSLR